MDEVPQDVRTRSTEREGRRRHSWRRAGVSGALAVALSGGVAAAAAVQTAGPQGDGTAITPVGYRVTPAGSQTTLEDLPLALQLSPDGSMLLASNDGQGSAAGMPQNQSVQVIDPATSQVTQTIQYTAPAAVFYGLAFSPDGSKAYASGGGSEIVHTYTLGGGHLTEGAPLNLPTTNPSGQPINAFPAGLQVTPDGTKLVVADHLADAVSVVPVDGSAASTVPVGHAPLGVALSPDGKTAFVSNQGGNTVSVVDISGATPVLQRSIVVGTHPNSETLDATAGRLYVADGDSDQVSVISTSSDTVLGTIGLAPYQHANVGSNPVGLTLSPDRSTLYAANSGNNDVAVIDLTQGNIRGLVPTAWYPTSVVATAGKLYVANGKGLGAGPNDGPGYPNPESTGAQSPAEYDASMQLGTLSTIGLPLSQGTLTNDTNQVAGNDGFTGSHSSSTAAQPIKHVIYVVRENRTYDREFGSLGKGNGDSSLNLFGDTSAPNSRNLEKNFTTLDNFYADAEVSAQGWNWDVAANSNPYSESLYPANYSPRNGPYPSESNDTSIAPNVNPADAYIWDRLQDSGVSFRNYGFYVSRNSSGQYVAGDPVLNNNTDHSYVGFDLNCPDAAGTFTPMGTECGSQARVDVWKNEFNQYVANNSLPSVELVRLPNDHTNGTAPGKPTPQEYVADNDLALGQLVDAVSHSQYWSSTAIFVTEDDAQNGPDHVDAHRTTSMLISPYTQTGKVDSSFYSTVSMLRTIEDIVGIHPMTQFDTFATPMSASFTNKPNPSPYTAVRPADAGNTLNTAAAPLSQQSIQAPTTADELNSAVLNQAIWKSVKGADSAMPSPQNGLGGGTQDSADPAGN